MPPRPPLPIGGRVGLEEWRERLLELEKRADRLRHDPGPAIEARARLALDALALLWPALTPELVGASVRASLLAGLPVVVGRPLALALLDTEQTVADSQGLEGLEVMRCPPLLQPPQWPWPAPAGSAADPAAAAAPEPEPPTPAAPAADPPPPADLRGKGRRKPPLRPAAERMAPRPPASAADPPQPPTPPLPTPPEPDPAPDAAADGKLPDWAMVPPADPDIPPGLDALLAELRAA